MHAMVEETIEIGIQTNNQCDGCDISRAGN